MNEKVRDMLPDSVKMAFDSIVEQRVLGAGNHISMIGDMIEAIALEENKTIREIVENIKQVSDFFMETRGEASQAVSNAILLMIHGIEQCIDLDRDTAVSKIIMTKNSYLQTAKKASEQIVAYAVTLAQEMNTIFVFDYSSTVEEFLKGLQANEKQYTVYIAESRIIDGGKAFVMPCKEAGHEIKFIPDAAMMYYLKDCDAAFMGAETFYPDGTGFNTTGSDIVGLICKYYRIPLYFLTPLIKLDSRPVFGGRKNLVFNDLKEKCSKDWSAEIEKEKIDFVTPELIGVEPEFIKAFVTEKGIIPSNQMYEVSKKYNQELRGKKDEQRI